MSFPTWSDLNDKGIIEPYGARRGFESGSSLTVMVSTDPDLTYIKSNATKGTSKPLFMGTLFTQGEKGASFAGPYMGAPYAAMIAETLIAKGTGTIVVFGWCGAISPGLSAGDIIVVDGALSDEGTSRNYMEQPEPFPRVLPDPELQQRLYDELSARELPVRTGTLWTTDAIYRETPKKIEYFRDRGAVAVEMECSALFAVAKYRKARIAAVVVVSDELSGDAWKPGFRSKRFKTSRKQVADTLLDLCRKDDL
ncbi:MAG: nucleoside phosphorylase [Desulfobacteraceae bacterium]|nr:nucleoside phosphorylase [Desulfobacteraceae bacterium]